MNFEAIQKGKPHPFKHLLNILPGQEGTNLTFYKNSHPTLRVYFNKPTQYEVDQFKAGIELKLKLYSFKQCIFLLFKAGNLPWCDVPYNNSIEVSERRIVDFPDLSGGKKLILNIEVLDSSDYTVKHLRSVSLSSQFSERFILELKKQNAEPTSLEKHQSTVNEAYISHPTTNSMVKAAFVSCKGGSD